MIPDPEIEKLLRDAAAEARLQSELPDRVSRHARWQASTALGGVLARVAIGESVTDNAALGRALAELAFSLTPDERRDAWAKVAVQRPAVADTGREAVAWLTNLARQLVEALAGAPTRQEAVTLAGDLETALSILKKHMYEDEVLPPPEDLEQVLWDSDREDNVELLIRRIWNRPDKRD